MKEDIISIRVQCCTLDELCALDRELIECAMKMTETSYSPYSDFQVGAALRVADGRIFGGSNQENAAYPDGLCAERTAFFYAQANAPESAPRVLAIAAQTGGQFTDAPVPPCGSCRQALLEAEVRYGEPIRVLLYGRRHILMVGSVSDLLPLNFDGSSLS